MLAAVNGQARGELRRGLLAISKPHIDLPCSAAMASAPMLITALRSADLLWAIVAAGDSGGACLPSFSIDLFVVPHASPSKPCWRSAGPGPGWMRPVASLVESSPVVCRYTWLGTGRLCFGWSRQYRRMATGLAVTSMADGPYEPEPTFSCFNGVKRIQWNMAVAYQRR